MPLTDNIEWWDGPADDDEVLIYARRIQADRQALDSQAPVPTNWQASNAFVKLLWVGAFIGSIGWAACLGLVGIVCLIPPLTPLGLVLIPMAGSPTVVLTAWRMKPARRYAQPQRPLPPPPPPPSPQNA